MGIASKALSIVSGVFNAATTPAVNALKALASGASGAADNALDWVKSLVHDGIVALGNEVDDFNKVIHDAWNFAHDAVNVLEGGLNALGDSSITAWHWLTHVKLPVINQSLSTLGSNIATLADWTSRQLNSLAQTARDLASGALSDAEHFAIDNIFNPLTSVYNDLRNLVNTLWNFVHGYIDDPLNLAALLLDPLLTLVVKGWQSVGRKAGDALLAIVLTQTMAAANLVESIVADMFD